MIIKATFEDLFNIPSASIRYMRWPLRPEARFLFQRVKSLNVVVHSHTLEELCSMIKSFGIETSEAAPVILKLVAAVSLQSDEVDYYEKNLSQAYCIVRQQIGDFKTDHLYLIKTDHLYLKFPIPFASPQT
jgi:hypothetical protein